MHFHFDCLNVYCTSTEGTNPMALLQGNTPADVSPEGHYNSKLKEILNNIGIAVV